MREGDRSSAKIRPAVVKAVASILLATAVLDCSTGGRDIETPQGPRSPDQTGPFIVLGVVSRMTSTGHRSNASSVFEEEVTVSVPTGTQIIIPTLRGWSAGYGSTTPADLSAQPNPNDTYTWNSEDHHLGIALVNVWVDRVNAVDNSTTPATQTAVIKIRAILSDDNHDDQWWAWVTYNLLCLGPHP